MGWGAIRKPKDGGLIMLGVHTIIYFLAKTVPAAVAFLTIPFFTRMMTLDEYGQYSIIVATTQFIQMIAFSWIRLSVLRMVKAAAGRREVVLSTAALSFVAASAVSVVAALAVQWTTEYDPVMVWCGLALLLVTSWLDMTTDLVRAELKPLRYASLLLSKSVLGTGLSILFLSQGGGVIGALAGLLVGVLLPALVSVGRDWSGVHPNRFDRALVLRFAAYGVPLAVWLGATIVIRLSDRAFLGWMVGTDVVGLYSAAFDLADKTLVVVMQSVGLAAFPLVVNAFETGGADKAREQMVVNFSMLMALALPSAAGLFFLRENFSQVFLGNEFQQSAVELMPIILAGTFVGGISMYFLSYAFSLMKETMALMSIFLAAAAVKIATTVTLIPIYGMFGAALSSLVAYSVAGFLCWYIGRKFFHFSIDFIELARILACTFLMSVSLWLVRDLRGGGWFVAQIFAGGTAYALSALLFDVLGTRSRISKIVGRLMRNKA